MSKTKAFVLASGGIDSSTCLALAADFHGKENVTGISIHYGQRHEREIEAAKTVCFHLGIRPYTSKLAEQAPSMLTDPDQPITNASYDELPAGQSPTYVHFRNGQLISHITMIASGSLKEDEDGYIYFGAHAEDAARWAYPDCTPEFIGAMANAVYVGTYFKVRLAAPFSNTTKSEIIRMGSILQVPYELTWSCYKGGEKHCGVCPTCRARAEAFSEAGVVDPTQYEVNPLTTPSTAELQKTNEGIQKL